MDHYIKGLVYSLVTLFVAYLILLASGLPGWGRQVFIIVRLVAFFLVPIFASGYLVKAFRLSRQAKRLQTQHRAEQKQAEQD